MQSNAKTKIGKLLYFERDTRYQKRQVIDPLQWILEGDIKSCFDKISHHWLLAHVPIDRVILQKWLKSGYMEKHVLHETTDGTPQGGIISPALANCALDALERLLREKYPAGKRLKSLGGEKPCVNLVRYADDFVITSTSKELLEGEIKPLVEHFLQERGLELSPKKTVITHVEYGFDFLGQNVRSTNGLRLYARARAFDSQDTPWPGVYVSHDGSDNWQLFSTDLIVGTTVAEHEGLVLGVTTAGVVESSDNGRTWSAAEITQKLPTSLPLRDA